jgi:transcriptional regulator with XRE-family HTH domain
MSHGTETPLGKRLLELRLKRGLSLRDIAAETGVADSLLSKMERGLTAQPTQSNLNRLAEFYEIDPEELWTLADYHISTRLPAVGPYLRSRYKLPEEAVHEMESYFDYIQQKYGDDIEVDQSDDSEDMASPSQR